MKGFWFLFGFFSWVFWFSSVFSLLSSFFLSLSSRPSRPRPRQHTNTQANNWHPSALKQHKHEQVVWLSASLVRPCDVSSVQGRRRLKLGQCQYTDYQYNTKTNTMTAKRIDEDVAFLKIARECAEISLPSVFLQVALLLPFTFSTMVLGKSKQFVSSDDSGSSSSSEADVQPDSTSAICLSSF